MKCKMVMFRVDPEDVHGLVCECPPSSLKLAFGRVVGTILVNLAPVGNRQTWHNNFAQDHCHHIFVVVLPSSHESAVPRGKS